MHSAAMATNTPFVGSGGWVELSILKCHHSLYIRPHLQTSFSRFQWRGTNVEGSITLRSSLLSDVIFPLKCPFIKQISVFFLPLIQFSISQGLTFEVIPSISIGCPWSHFVAHALLRQLVYMWVLRTPQPYQVCLVSGSVLETCPWQI